MNAYEYFDSLQTRKIQFIIDDEKWRDIATRQGFRVVHFDEVDFLRADAEPSFLFLTRLDYHRKLMSCWETAKSVTSHLALAKFDTAQHVVEYSLEQFFSIDFHDTLNRRSKYYDVLLSCKDAKVVTKAGVLTCRFRDEIEVANADIDLAPGWLYSVAEFFESSIVNLEGDGSSFALSGDFGFDGLLYLCSNEPLKRSVTQALDEWMRLSTTGDNLVTFLDNRIQRLVIGGKDQTALLQELSTGKERETSSTEFALGCVEYGRAPNWTINSVLNEATNGAHVGMGFGREIPHIDFIAKGAELLLTGPEGTEDRRFFLNS